MTMRAIGVAMVICLILATAAGAAVDYLPERDLLWVTDYPADFPCTPRLLDRVDDRFGWGKVEYDEATDTCTVACNLWIGANDGSDTCLQVGGAARPEETLIVRGDLRVHSAWLIDENTGTHRDARGIVNRLTLGARDDAKVHARLLIDNEERAGHTLTVGGYSGYGSENSGGQLLAYDSTIGPLGDVPVGATDGGSRPGYMGGQERIELIGTTVRGFAGRAFGRHLSEGLFMRTRFEDCGVAVHGTYQQTISGCTFADCGTAVIGSSRYELVLRDCTFTGNERNWALLYQPLIAIDCEIDSYEKGLYSAEKDTFFVSRRHVVVQVMDGEGRPVKGAEVSASTTADILAPRFELQQATTDAEGRSPGPEDDGGLLLSELVIRAPEAEGGEPVRSAYAWTIEARAGDRSGRVEGFTPRESHQTVEITIAKDQPQEDQP